MYAIPYFPFRAQTPAPWTELSHKLSDKSEAAVGRLAGAILGVRRLRRAALHRELHYGCTDSKRDVEVMQLRLKLALERARKSRVDAMAGGAGTMLKQAALRVIGSQLRPARRSEEEPSAAEKLKLPRRVAVGDARDAPVDSKPVSVGLLPRESERSYSRSYNRLAIMYFWLAKSDFSRQIERVFVICATIRLAERVTALADEIGARLALDEGVYKGKGANEKIKRAHFKDTRKPWLWADVVIATSTLSVGVKVRVHFACCFLYTTANAHAAKLRELFQGLVRVGRDPKDPLGDERSQRGAVQNEPRQGGLALVRPPPVEGQVQALACPLLDHGGGGQVRQSQSERFDNHPAVIAGFFQSGKAGVPINSAFTRR